MRPNALPADELMYKCPAKNCLGSGSVKTCPFHPSS